MGYGHRKAERNPLFAGRWFEDDIILLCLRWYFRFKLSYRDRVAILAERGLPIAHTTILPWVVHYAATCEKRWRRFERPVGRSWRVDETFIKVRGQWMYLYRAVDGQGNTVEFFLSRTRGIAAAKAFFRKALKHHREPPSITLDGHRPSHSARRRMGMNGECNFRGRSPGEKSLLSIPEQRPGAGPPPGEGALAPDVGIQDILQCATRDYRHRVGAEASHTPVRNSDPMAVESRPDLASRHGSIARIAVAHSWSYRSDNPICTRTPATILESPPRLARGSLRLWITDPGREKPNNYLPDVGSKTPSFSSACVGIFASN